MRNTISADPHVFAINLQFLMQQKGTDITGLAKDLNVNRRRVIPWTEARCFPKHEMMVELCNYFKFYDIYTLITKPIADKQAVKV